MRPARPFGLLILIGFSLSASIALHPASVTAEAAAKRAALGVLFAPGNSDGPRTPGVRIEAVFPKGPAEKAGLRAGDVIRQVDDVEVDNQEALVKEIHKHPAGSQVPLLYLHEGKESQAVVTVVDEGEMYANADALAMLKAAAEHGEAWAQSYLGVMYANGQGVTRDGAEAVKWYRKAADQGHAGAQFKLGVIYEGGRGVPRDEAEAATWYRKAAEQGNGYAQFNLATMYEGGRGVAMDEAEAAKWYRKAAEQGNRYAQFNLGAMRHFGRGAARDDVAAYMWFLLSAAAGDRDAQRNLDAMKLDEAQIGEAKRRAAAWTAYLHRTEEPEAPALAAETAGHAQEAFQGYLTALQALPDPPPVEADRRIRERIIHLASQLDPPPAIPEEARRHAADAAAAFKESGPLNGPGGLGHSIAEWRESLRLAPWWAEAYSNYAAALEQRGDFGEAAQNLKFYLLAAPNAQDAVAVKQKTLELELKVRQQGG